MSLNQTFKPALDIPPKRFLYIVGVLIVATVFTGWIIPHYRPESLLIPIVLIIGVLVVLLRPHIGLYFLVLTIPISNVIQLSGGDVTWTRAIGIIVIFSWLLHRILERKSWSPILSANIWKPALLFVGFAAISLIWSNAGSLVKVLTAVQLLVFSTLVIDLVDSRHRLEWVMRMLIIGGLIAAVMTIEQSISTGVGRAGDTISGGLNFTAATLLLIIPIGFFYMRIPRNILWQVVGLIYVVLALWAISLTLSRISFVVLPVLFALQVLLVSKELPRLIPRLLLLVPIVAIVMFMYVPLDRVIERGSTIFPSEDLGIAVDKDRSSGRFALWLGGLAMFGDNPLLGVGFGNFGNEYRDTYQFDVPDEYYARIVTTSRSPHSTIIGIAAELGMIGIVLWIWLSVVAFKDLARSWVHASRGKNIWDVRLIQALVLILIGFTIFSIFSITGDRKLLWLIFGLAGAIGNVTARSQQERALS